MQIRPFTLIELMLIIAILGITTAVVGIKSYQAMQRHRFTSSVDTVVGKLVLAERIMSSCHCNVTVEFRSDGSKMCLALKADENLSPGYKCLLGRPTMLPCIDCLAWNQQQEPVQLAFIYDRGHKFPKGTLRLSFEGEERFVHLPGYLSPLKAVLTEETQDSSANEASDAPPIPNLSSA